MDKEYTFKCFGHPNVRATHPKTLEFSKDEDLTERGDCIVGIKADFDVEQLKQFSGKVRITCEVTGDDGEVMSSTFRFKVNPQFSSDHELVLRKSGFQSERTYGFGLNRGSNHLDRKIVELMQEEGREMRVTLTMV